MALFRRKQNATTALPEIEKYYEAERRDRSGLAWLLAIASIIAVAIVIIGVFFGGRWLYHKAVHKTPKAPIAAQTASKPTPDNSSQNSTSDSSKSSEGTSSTKTTTNSGAGSTSTPANNTQPTTSATTTPSTTTSQAQTPSKLTNTGPEDIVPAFFIATFLGVILYRLKVVRD